MLNNLIFRLVQNTTIQLSKSTRCFSASSSRKSINNYTERTHNCGQLRLEDVGSQVKLCGWVQQASFRNKIVHLRDSHGTTQCIIEQKFIQKVKLHNESVVKVSGTVVARPKGQENEKLSTGYIEIKADDIEILNQADKDLPILNRADLPEPTWETKLKYRYLNLRSPEMQRSLRFRSHVENILRTKLLKLKFIECETPTLYSRTPGGASEFIVPTKEPNQFYSLVQSPQILKQLLMISGFEGYFQRCRCYRDEGVKSDRQPEFTQIDIELAFTNQESVMRLVDDLIHDLGMNVSTYEATESLLSSFNSSQRINRISFEDALSKYGTDKPDTRFEWLIETIDKRVQICVPYAVDEPFLQGIISTEKISSNIEHNVHFEVNTLEQFTNIWIESESNVAKKLLGRIRVSLAKEFSSQGKHVYKEKFSFLWVVDFPLFTLNDRGNIEPNHHPFTAPTKESIHQLKDEPLKVIGQHYDLVLNGQEVAGGSIRIHEAELQKEIFDILKIDEADFEYFTKALRSGCPPHGGIAFGFDRLVAILLGKESIRDVIAFPKSVSGRDPLSKCPHALKPEVKRLYHIN